MKRFLIVVTNISKYETINRATGLWFGEAVHFADVMYAHGYEIDFVSPNGGYTPIDPHSLQEDFMTPLDWAYYQNHDFMALLGNTKRPEDIHPNDYEGIYYAGGHGVVWDFKDNVALQRLARQIHENGGIISSVCHGAVGLLNITDAQHNKLIDGVKVTGFSNSEERAVGLDAYVPFLTEDELKAAGAHYDKAEDWSEYAVVDGSFVTGQNPQSGKAVADAIVKHFKK